jgi:hypothetical protein
MCSTALISRGKIGTVWMEDKHTHSLYSTHSHACTRAHTHTHTYAHAYNTRMQCLHAQAETDEERGRRIASQWIKPPADEQEVCVRVCVRVCSCARACVHVFVWVCDYKREGVCMHGHVLYAPAPSHLLTAASVSMYWSHS